MKVIIFNDDREVLDEIEGIRDPEAYSTEAVRWIEGGISGIQHNYVIVEDDQKLEDLTEEDIFNQLKYQEKIDLAREYEEDRIKAMAEGREEEEKQRFETAREKINNAADRESIVLARHAFRNNKRAAAPAAPDPQNKTDQTVAE